MKIEYRVIKREGRMPADLSQPAVFIHGWYEIRQVYFEGDTPRMGNMDRGVNGGTVETFMDSFNEYGKAVFKPTLVMSVADDTLMREDPPIFDQLTGGEPTGETA